MVRLKLSPDNGRLKSPLGGIQVETQGDGSVRGLIGGPDGFGPGIAMGCTDYRRYPTLKLIFYGAEVISIVLVVSKICMPAVLPEQPAVTLSQKLPSTATTVAWLERRVAPRCSCCGSIQFAQRCRSTAVLPALTQGLGLQSAAVVSAATARCSFQRYPGAGELGSTPSHDRC